MSFQSLMNFIDKRYTSLINRLDYITYQKHFRFLLRRSPKQPVTFSREEIKQYKKKWKRLSSRFSINDYLLFSRYIGKDINIVPESISHYYIETLLNPIKYRAFYDDKNVFDKLFPVEYMPKTFLRCINGIYYDKDFSQMTNLNDEKLKELCYQCDSVIIKPSVNTGSGKGVCLFLNNGNGFNSFTDSKITLDVDYLQKFCGDNFIIQERLQQSSFLSMFNPTSINTLRLLVYKSVVDDSLHIVNAALRVGKSGSYLDNAHAGGTIIGIYEDGSLGHFACNQYGDTFNHVNNVDLENKTYQIPEYEKIKQFAIKVCRHIIHHRCISLDIAIDVNGNPRLIEFNLDSLGVWAWQYTVKAAFGEYTDEIIDYCIKHKHDALKVYSIRN